MAKGRIKIIYCIEEAEKNNDVVSHVEVICRNANREPKKETPIYPNVVLSY